jgi:hypothetical protein
MSKISPDLVVEPYFVKGYIADAKGNPLDGIKVYAENQLSISSYLSTVTDGTGFYSIELPPFATTWKVSACTQVNIDSRTYPIDLTPDNDIPFDTSKGAVRNLMFKQDNATILVMFDFHSQVNAGLDLPIENLELTLTPIGPSQIGGFEGEETTQFVRKTANGEIGLDDILIGKYQVTGKFYLNEYEYVPLLIRERYKGDYVEAFEFDFIPEWSHRSYAKLEVLPYFE